MKFLVDGMAFDTAKARLAVDVTVRDMDACTYRKGVLYRTVGGRWIVVTKFMGTKATGTNRARLITDGYAKKLLTAAGQIDLVKKYFGKISRA
jgi:hypothetical protein